MYASFYGHFRIAKILLEHQAFVDVKNKVSPLAVSIYTCTVMILHNHPGWNYPPYGCKSKQAH